MAKKKLTKKQLKDAYEELNEVVPMEADEGEEPINEKLDVEGYKKELWETFESLEVEDDEFEELSDKAQDVFNQLKEEFTNKEETEEDDEDEEEEHETEEDEEKQQSSEPEPTNENPEPVYKRVDALVDALDGEPKTLDEWVEEAERVYKKNQGKKKSQFSEKKFSLEFLVMLNKKFKLDLVPIS